MKDSASTLMTLLNRRLDNMCLGRILITPIKGVPRNGHSVYLSQDDEVGEHLLRSTRLAMTCSRGTVD